MPSNDLYAYVLVRFVTRTLGPNSSRSNGTDVYTGRGTLVTLRESIELNQRNGVKHTPELESGDPARIQAVFGGQEQYAQKLADEMLDAGVRLRDAWPKSFNVNDVATGSRTPVR